MHVKSARATLMQIFNFNYIQRNIKTIDLMSELFLFNKEIIHELVFIFVGRYKTFFVGNENQA